MFFMFISISSLKVYNIFFKTLGGGGGKRGWWGVEDPCMLTGTKAVSTIFEVTYVCTYGIKEFLYLCIFCY